MSVWEVDCQEMMKVELWWYACIFLVPLFLPIPSFLPLPSLLSSLLPLPFLPPPSLLSLLPPPSFPLSFCSFIGWNDEKNFFTTAQRSAIVRNPQATLWLHMMIQLLWSHVIQFHCCYNITWCHMSHDVTWCHWLWVDCCFSFLFRL